MDDTNDYYTEKLLEHGIIVINRYAKIRRKKNINQYQLLFTEINHFLKKHKNISAIHVHETNQALAALLAAKKNQISVICMHSHAAYSEYWNPKLFPLKSRIAEPIMRLFEKYIPSHKIGCSWAACERMFGKSKNQYFIPNGIDMDKFNSSRIVSKIELQKKYLFDNNDCNFIFVGRFSSPKNPLFMLEVISKLREIRSNIKLSIIGYGEMEEEIRLTVKKLNLENTVRFLSSSSNIPELLKASDYFISPSIYEGLGIVFVEAQLMGIPAFASDQVPKEADLGLCEFVPLSLGSSGYAKYIDNYILSEKQKKKTLNLDKVKLYDMKEVIKIYERIYCGEKVE